MIVAHKPRCNNHIVTAKPIVANLHTGEVSSPLNTLYISLIAIVKIVIARNKVHTFKVCIEVLQGS
jgi:hypothetical protein